MKWVVDTLGFDELKRRVLRPASMLPASSTWPGGIPDVVAEARRRARRASPPASLPTVDGPGHARHADGTRSVRALGSGQRRARHRQAARSRPYAYAALGDITGDQFRALASIQRELGRRRAADEPPERRVPRPHRGAAARPVRAPARRSAWPSPAPSWPATSSPARAPTRATSPSPSRAASPKAIGDRLEEEGLADVGGVRINISGCTNSCGQHHAVDIGFFGVERRAHDQAAPGYTMLLGGYVGQEQIHFGDKALRLPAKTAPDAAVRVVRRFAEERQAGETFRGWLDRSGGAHGRWPSACRPRRVPVAGRRARVLRRLRRDRAVREGDRRVGVRHLTLA